jgi:hypothetical protein
LAVVIGGFTAMRNATPCFAGLGATAFCFRFRAMTGGKTADRRLRRFADTDLSAKAFSFQVFALKLSKIAYNCRQISCRNGVLSCRQRKL